MDVVDAIDIALPRSHQRPVLRAIIHSVLFHRALGSITPTTEEVFGCHVATILDNDISTYVNTKVESYWQRCNAVGKYSGQVAIVFSQRRSKKSWFSSVEETIPFEAHIITLSEPMTSSRTNADAEARTKNELVHALEGVLMFCAGRTGQIPAISSGTVQFPFPYEIIIDPPSPSEIFTTSTEVPISPSTVPISTPTTTTTNTRTRVEPVTSLSSSPMTTTDGEYGTPRARRESSVKPGSATNAALGYLESAKGGLMAVGGKVGGAVGGWSGGKS